MKKLSDREIQERIDYSSSDELLLDQIAKAIYEANPFEAIKLILIRQGQADKSNATFRAWLLGPEKGHAMIMDYIEMFDQEED